MDPAALWAFNISKLRTTGVYLRIKWRISAAQGKHMHIFSPSSLEQKMFITYMLTHKRTRSSWGKVSDLFALLCIYFCSSANNQRRNCEYIAYILLFLICKLIIVQDKGIELKVYNCSSLDYRILCNSDWHGLLLLWTSLRDVSP